VNKMSKQIRLRDQIKLRTIVYPFCFLGLANDKLEPLCDCEPTEGHDNEYETSTRATHKAEPVSATS
jgi:hypothetical protein